ncbi:MAG: 1-acyl-sn-glycerol-3-phosphate acyltransferase [Bacteroidota bacterium]
MLYWILKIVVPIGLRIFYKNPLVRNADFLPKGVPVIIASNHPNAVNDPVTIAGLSNRRVRFLTRGDVFKNKILHWIFAKQFGMIPIYRLQEGSENLHRNEETFFACNEILKKKQSILVFSEGFCVQERRLRKLKKGTARIAFGAEKSADWKLGLVVVPVGLNYSAPKKFRSTLVVNYGKPITVAPFIELYKKDASLAINAFTKNLQEELSKLVIHIDDPVNDTLVSDLEMIYKKQLLEQKGKNPFSKENNFVITGEIVKAVNYFHKNNPEMVMSIRKKINEYRNLLEQLKTRDWVIREMDEKKLRITNLLFQTILLFTGVPIHIFGLINNYLPYKIAYTTANRIVKSVEFHSSVNMNFGMLLYLIFYSLQILVLALIFRNWWILSAYIILLPLSGFFSLYYYSFLKKTFGRLRFYSLWKRDKNAAEKIISLRQQIIKSLEKAKKDLTIL